MLFFHALLKAFFINLIVLIVIVLIVLFPRNMEAVDVGKTIGANIEFEYGFDWTQYYVNISTYLQTLFVEKSLGESLTGVPVSQIIHEYFPRSLTIIVTSLFLSLIFGILKGIFDFQAKFRKRSILGQGLTSFMLSIPDFFIILCLQWIIIFHLPVINVFGYDHWYSFLLPSILVSIYPMMYIARITSLTISNQESQPYTHFARAKGLTKKMVFYKHVLKNCWPTILGHVSTVMLYILSNLLIVEYLLDYKGAAYRLFKAFNYTNSISASYEAKFEAELIIAIATCFMILVTLSLWFSQIVKVYVDPRRR
ncbi:ABC transporter permease [Pseudalkalibacillus sp. SCS-8]|uniref:ABC transporter permease n=1 Tax=Pseudalkalibacillus nanhaiensis TaxID=3115291 RepID=UPI0032DAB0CF